MPQIFRAIHTYNLTCLNLEKFHMTVNPKRDDFENFNEQLTGQIERLQEKLRVSVERYSLASSAAKVRHERSRLAGRGAAPERTTLPPNPTVSRQTERSRLSGRGPARIGGICG